MLFHVEHSGRDLWFYRWRIVGPYPPAYLEWREGRSEEARVVLHPEVSGCLLDAQWRLLPTDEWGQATLQECSTGTASFKLRARNGFSAPNGFRVLALLPGEFVACYHFGPLTLAPGQQAPVTGTADGPFADNVLLAAGDFRSYSADLEVDNLGPSAGSLLPASEDDESSRLRVADGAASRRLFVVSRMVQFDAPAVAPDPAALPQ